MTAKVGSGKKSNKPSIYPVFAAAIDYAKLINSLGKVDEYNKELIEEVAKYKAQFKNLPNHKPDPRKNVFVDDGREFYSGDIPPWDESLV